MNSSALRRIFWGGNLLLLIYLVTAIIFAQERIFLDGTYYFFHIVQSESFHIEHQRFILAASQVLAVIGANFHLPLSTLLILNSVNPVIYLWVLFLLSILWLKNESIAWALLLSSVCGIYFIWFCPMYEVWYGCVLLIFFAGVLEKKFYDTPIEKVIFTALVITLLFSYPLIFIGVLYFSLSHFIREKRIPLSVLLMYAAGFTFWLLWKKIFISSYEEGKIEYPVSQLGNTIRNTLLSATSIKSLSIFLFRVYPEELIAAFIAILFLFFNRQRLQAIVLTGFFFGFIIVINVTQPQAWSHTNYFERMYLLLIPLSFVPFLQYDYRASRYKLIVEFLLVIVIGIRFYQIISHSKDYKNHNDQIEALVTEASKGPGSKFMVDFPKHPELQSLDEWSLPMETIIFSSVKNPHRSITISWKAGIEDPEVSKNLDEEKFRLRLNEIYPDEWLNQKYFHLEKGNYHDLNW